MKAQEFQKLILESDENLKQIFSMSFSRDLLNAMQRLHLNEDQIRDLAPLICAHCKYGRQNVQKEIKNGIIRAIQNKIDLGEIIIENVRKVNQVSLRNRRLDLLARLLSPMEKYSACVAVTFHRNEFIVSFNSANYGTGINNENIQEDIVIKLQLLRHYLLKMNVKGEDFHKSDIDSFVKELYKKLQNVKTGFISNLPGRSTDDYYKAKIAKLLVSFINRTVPNGISDNDLRIFLNSSSITFLSPIASKIEQGGSQHAEQMIAHYLTLRKSQSEPVYIGISKLCCAQCNDVLNHFTRTQNIQFRGTHGGIFPNVMDIRTGEKFKTEKTRIPAPGDDVATDSNSLANSIPSDNLGDLVFSAVPQETDRLIKFDNQNYMIVKKDIKRYTESGSASEDSLPAGNNIKPYSSSSRDVMFKQMSYITKNPSSSGDANEDNDLEFVSKRLNTWS